MNLLFNPITNAKTIMSDTVSGAIDGYTDFLLSKNLLQVGVAFIVSTRLNSLANVFVDSVISPIINVILPGDKTLEEKKIIIGNLNISIGKLISESLKFLLITFFLYYIVIYLIGNKLLNKG